MRSGSRGLSFAVVCTLASSVAAFGCFEKAVQGHHDGSGVTPDPDNPAHHEVPVEGTAKTGLEGVDDAIQAWMRATCTGAVGISFGFGDKPLLARGYGFKEGPPNIVCQDKNGHDEYVGLDRTSANTPFRIGSNTKAITAAIVRDAIKQRLTNLGLEATDEKVESLKIMDEDFNLVSPAFRRAVKGTLVTGGPVTCAPPALLSSGSPVVDGDRADPRWLDITVGHLLSHKSGLPRGGNSTYLQLMKVRSLTTSALLDHEELVTAPPEQVKTEIRKILDGTPRFVRPQNLEEYLIANANLCFEFDPGGAPPEDEDDYSNFGFGILQHIAEHVTGKPFASTLGTHEQHDTSLLAAFNQNKLGFTKGNGSDYGIYFSQPVSGERDAREAVYRAWDGKGMQGMSWDTKRPWCTWNEHYDPPRVDCSVYLHPALDGQPHFNFVWQDAPVPVSYENAGFSAGPGLLAAEMPLLQKFMAKYWVSGDAVSNYYGRERATNPSNRSRYHHGKLPGAFSTVAQFMGDAVDYTIVPWKDGELDLSTLGEETPTASCKLPSGLNLAIAANQTSDAQCGGDGCGWRYRALREVVKEALCKVDWMKVSPQIANK